MSAWFLDSELSTCFTERQVVAELLLVHKNLNEVYKNIVMIKG